MRLKIFTGVLDNPLAVCYNYKSDFGFTKIKAKKEMVGEENI